MPTISRFHGIKIAIFYGDHPPPHFHASHSGRQGRFSIDPPGRLDGDLPRTVVRKVLRWARVHRRDLRADWHLAQWDEPLDPIPPLR